MFSFRFLFSIRSLLSLSALSGLTAAGVAGAWIVSSYRRDSEQKYIGGGGEGSSLVADPTALELGEVWESDAHRVEVPLTNKGETTITISRFATTCSCSSVEPTSIEIPPGETRRVVMALDLQPSSREEADKPTTDFSVDLTPFLAGEPEQQGPTWQVTARVRRPLLRTPRQIDLGWHSERAQPFEPVLVTVDIAPGIDGLKAFGTKMLVSLNRDKKGTSRYILSVTPIGPLQVGEVSGFVRLTPYRKGEALPSRTISVRGRVVDDVELTPTGVLFGTQSIGTTRTETVTLRSLTGTDFELVKVESRGVDTRVERSTGADANRRLLVHQKITAIGQYAGEIHLTVQDKDVSMRRIELPVMYFGTAASTK